MKRNLFFLLCLLFLGRVQAQINFDKIDTTMKMGKTGYKVNCRNKDIGSNPLSIRPIGFQSPAGENMNYPIRGRVAAAQVDDFNGDGFADLLLFIYTDSAAHHGTALALISDGEKSILPCWLPDPTMDGKINTGYKGFETFKLLEGTLLMKFPIFKPGEKDTPTGGNRVVQYNWTRTEQGGYKFNIVRFYDTH